MSCSPHSWTVISGKIRQGKAVGRNCLLWQCPCASTACLAFLDIPLFLLLPVTQTSDKYMFNAPFQHEASHGACRIKTDGLRVRLRQPAWICGNICFTKLPSALWQAGVSEHSWRTSCPPQHPSAVLSRGLPSALQSLGISTKNM